MNYLAHLYLSEPTPEAMVGNLLPDMVRGRLPDGLSPAVMAGVHNHRRVDRFTDAHPVFHRSRARLRPRCGRYAGILVDVFYDHLLATTWSRYHPVELDEFLDTAHRLLATDGPPVPEAMRPVAQAMSAERWMSSYATLSGVELTLWRMSRHMSRRFGRDVRLDCAVAELDARYTELASDFAVFFPDLIHHTGVDHRPARASDLKEVA